MTHPRPDGGYRPDIDGLRAIAVLSVVLFHIDERLVPGGYTGVDIFFVISGYLITAIIARQMAAGTFSFLAFYRRRILRIAPAYFVVVLATLAAGLLLMLPEDFADLARSALWSAFSLPNVHFWLHLDTGYFADATDQLPLLHLWSLGVEEQFYVVWPLALLALLMLTRLSGRGWLLPILAAMALASFWYAQRMAVLDHSFAYYMLPTRAGELLVGAMLAIALTRPAAGSPPQRTRPAWLDELAALAGLLLIACGLFGLDRESHFPGWNALLPCLGTALAIWSGRHGGIRITRLLSLPPMVGIGLISYSLYLWHWPILAFVRYFTTTIDPATGVACFVAMLVLSWLSYRWVEQPFRRLRPWPGSRGLGVPAAYALAVALFAGVTVASVHWSAGNDPAADRLAVRTAADGEGGPDEAAPASPALAGRVYTLTERTRPAFEYGYNCQLSSFNPAMFEPGRCIWRPADTPDDAPVWGILLGDSNAAHHIGVIGTIAAASGLAFRSAVVSSCPPVPGSTGNFGRRGREHECQAYRDALDHAVEPYEAVIMGAVWTHYDNRTADFWTDLENTVKTWTGRGKTVILLGQVPRFGGYDRRCELRRLRLPMLDCQAMAADRVNDYADSNARLRATAEAIPGAHYLDVTPVLCPDGECSPYLDGWPVYYDGGHLSMSGSWDVGATLAKNGFDPTRIGLPEPSSDNSAATFSPQWLATPLPRDMFVGFRYHARHDRTAALDDGRRQRRIRFDFFGQEIDAVAENVDAMLTRAGYLPRPGKPAQDGVRRHYRHPDGATATLAVREARPYEELAPGARGRVHLDLVE